MDHSHLISPKRAAEMLDENRSNIYFYIKKNWLTEYKIDDKVFVSIVEIQLMAKDKVDG